VQWRKTTAKLKITPNCFAEVDGTIIQQSVASLGMKALEKYFEGAISISKLLKAKHTDPSKPAFTGQALCLIPADAPEQDPFALASTGWSSSSSSSQIHVFIAPDAGTKTIVLTVAFRHNVTRGCHEWSVRPRMLDLAEQPCVAVVHIEDAWVEVLCRLASKAIGPLLHFQPSVEWVKKCVNHEISVMCSSFARPGVVFSDAADQLAWQIAISWDRWEKVESSTDARLKEISSELNVKIEARTLLDLSPVTVASRLRRGSRSVDFIHFGETGDNNKSSHLPQIWQPPVKGKIASETDLQKSGLWWWRVVHKKRSASDWCEFVATWEMSSFFYELRARLSYYESPPQWEEFGRPWVYLTRSEKNVLYFLWPPLNAQNSKKRPTARKGLSAFATSALKSAYTIEVSLASPLEDVLAQVTKEWNAISKELVHVVGIQKEASDKMTANDNGSMDEAKDSSSIKGKWELLEAMDRVHYMGWTKAVLSKTDRTNLERSLISYKIACNESGIPSLIDDFERLLKVLSKKPESK
jgi:hypothetical protein